MGRRSLVLSATFLVLFSASFASAVPAGVPDPALSDVPNIIVSPDGGLSYTVTVVGADGPIDTALVQIIFTDEADSLLCWCVSSTHPVVEAMTDAAGQATFNVVGGGCLDPANMSGGVAAEVFANGIKLDEPAVVGPDAVDPVGLRNTDPAYSSGGNCSVGLSDATFHTGPIADGTFEICSDIDSNDLVGLPDAVLLTEYIANGTSCTEQ